MSAYQSEQINELVGALAKAQAEFPPIPRNREVKVRMKENKGEYTFKYATLDIMLDLCRPILAKNEIAIIQQVVGQDGGMLLMTKLYHGSGQWIGSCLPLYGSRDPQVLGSEITYKRRYAVAPLLGIAADEDDDANLNVGNGVEDNKPPKQPTQNAKPAGGNSAPPSESPASGSRRRPAPPEGDAGAARLVPPPEKGAISNRIAGSETLEDLNKFVAGLVDYQPVAQNPGLWHRIMSAVAKRLDEGAEKQGWTNDEANACEDALRASLPAIAASAIAAIQTPEALTRWIDKVRTDYWEADHQEWRDPVQLRAICETTTRRSFDGMHEQGWDHTKCNILADAIANCVKLYKTDNSNQENTHGSQNQESHPAEESHEPEQVDG